MKDIAQERPGRHDQGKGHFSATRRWSFPKTARVEKARPLPRRGRRCPQLRPLRRVALITGRIHVSELPDDFYEFDSVRLRFIGRKTKRIYKTGDAIQVIASRVDADKRQIDFIPADTKKTRLNQPSLFANAGRD